MRHRRDLGQQIRLYVLTRSEQLDRADAGILRRLDEILSFDDEQALLLALAPRVEQPMNEPKFRVRWGRDQAWRSSRSVLI
jgi:hypothetical protein